MSYSSPSADPSRSLVPYVLRQLHSLTGVAPVGVFLLLQLWANAKAQAGPHAFEQSLGWMIAAPLAAKLAVAVPLVFHAGFGIVLATNSEYSVGRYPYSRNWMYVLQRASGVLAFLFIGYHALRFWLPLYSEAASLPDMHARIERSLSSTWAGVPVAALLYAIGVAACAFHLGNGLPMFAARWGLTPARYQRSIATAIGALVGIVAFAIGAQTVFAVATGWGIEPAAANAIGGACTTAFPRGAVTGTTAFPRGAVTGTDAQGSP